MARNEDDQNLSTRKLVDNLRTFVYSRWEKRAKIKVGLFFFFFLILNDSWLI